MDFDEEYDGEYDEIDLEQIKKAIENWLEEDNFQEIAKYLSSYISSDEYLEAYINSENQDFEEEELLRFQIEKLKKFGYIVTHDDEIKELLVDYIANMNYDENDISSRMSTTKNFIAAIEIVSSFESKYFEMLNEPLNQILKQMNYNDFTIVYSNNEPQNFFNNPYLEDTILEKIKNMNKEEFIYFLRTTAKGCDGHNPKIVKAKLDKVKSFNDNFVTNVYKAVCSDSILYLDRVDALLDGIKNEKEELKVFSELSSLEFLRFLAEYEIELDELSPNILNSDIFLQKMKKLSRRDLIFLSSTFLQDYISYKVYGEEDNPEYKKAKEIYEKVLGEVFKKGLVDKKTFRTEYKMEDIKEAQEQLDMYHEINTFYSLPYRVAEFKVYADVENADRTTSNEDAEQKEYDELYYTNQISEDQESYEYSDDYEKIEKIRRARMMRLLNRYIT